MNPQIRRLALDLGPLLIFFAGFKYLGIFGATAAFMVAVLVALAAKFPLPVHFIGVGEGEDDLMPFQAANFAKALTGAA